MTQYERDELLVRLDERMEQTLEQAKKTNGRVSALEMWQAEVKGGNRVWLIVCSGMGVVLGALATIAVIFV